MNRLLGLAFSLLIPAVGLAQTTEALGVQGKLEFHAKSTLGPAALAGAAIYAGIMQKASFPREWGQGVRGYGKEFGSTVAASGIHSALAFGLDSTLAFSTLFV